jgi:dienelactone hydrolase
MYQKQRTVFEKSSKFMITLLFVFVWSMAIFAAGEDYSQAYQGPDVDSIYQVIRHSSPEYEVQEETVNFENEGMNLVATLVTPKGVKKPPVVITLNGFAEDRFYKEIPNTGGEHFYPRLSRKLAELGIATLRVDYRGSGESDGDYTMTTFSSQISDALAAVDYICKELKHQVNAKQIGMLGFSQGGLVTTFAASMDKRIDSAVLWSAVVSPEFTYSNLLTYEGVRNGVALQKHGTLNVPIYVGDLFLGNIDLGQGFFEEIFRMSPRAAVKKFKKPLMYVAGEKDPIVFPQPITAQSLLDHHEGLQKLVLLPGDHEFDSDYGYEQFDDAIYWAAAWYIRTLKVK